MIVVLIAGITYSWNANAMRKNAALVTAAEQGTLAMVDRLLRAGADVDSARGDGSTPLLVASRAGHAPIIRRLIEAGADLRQTHWAMGSPLQIAVMNDRTEVVEILLDHGADPNSRSAAGDPMVSLAAVRGSRATLLALLRAGADPNGASKDGSSPLANAYGNPPAVQLLMDYGAEPDLAPRVPDITKAPQHQEGRPASFVAGPVVGEGTTW